VRLLLLSATISNAEEITAWLRENRKTTTWVVRSEERPVPLEMLFLFPDGLISPLTSRRGLSPKVRKFSSPTKSRAFQEAGLRRDHRLPQKGGPAACHIFSQVPNGL